MEMPFGKYKGTQVSDVPVSYLQWAWREVKPKGGLRREIANVLGIDVTCPENLRVKFSNCGSVMYWEPPYDCESPKWPDGFGVEMVVCDCPF